MNDISCQYKYFIQTLHLYHFAAYVHAYLSLIRNPRHMEIVQLPEKQSIQACIGMSLCHLVRIKLVRLLAAEFDFDSVFPDGHSSDVCAC
jgi:hypothetical protein